MSASAVAISTLGDMPGAPPLLRAGVSVRRVTPPTSIPYLKSAAKGTSAAFRDVHCDLKAKALVLDDGRKQMAVLAVDSIGYDNTILGEGRHFTRELRRKIATRTPLRPEAIMLSATHAHSAPETIGLSAFRKVPGAAEWLEDHLTDLAQTVVDAWRKREGVTASFGRRNVQGIARHRRIMLKDGTQNRHGPLPEPAAVATPWTLDEDASLLYFKRADGSCHSVLMNYTAHPVIAMLLPDVCADYPGVATELFEKKFPGSVCLFTQGAAGNVNPVHVSSKYDDVQRLGEMLAQAAIDEVERLGQSDLIRDADLDFSTAELQLRPRPCPSLAEAELRLSQTSSDADQRMARLARKLSEDRLRVEVQLMSVGHVKWISLPGEPFVESGLALKRAGATFVVGYANGWHGYFPIRSAYEDGGYEVELGAWSRVAPGSAEELETAAKALLAKSPRGNGSR